MLQNLFSKPLRFNEKSHQCMDISRVLLPLLTLHELGPLSDKKTKKNQNFKSNSTGAQGELYRVANLPTKLELVIFLSLSYVIHHREDSVTFQLNIQMTKGEKKKGNMHCDMGEKRESQNHSGWGRSPRPSSPTCAKSHPVPSPEP